MDWKKKALRNSRLYLILDRQACGRRPLAAVLKKALRAGVDLVQYRDKICDAGQAAATVRELLRISRRARVPLIVNDRLDVCLAADADGLHVGQDDLPAGKARKILGPKKIIGLSCGSLADVARADRGRIDYLGFGPVFATALKPGIRKTGAAEFRKAQKISRLPVFGIGGITAGRLRRLRSAGQPLRVAVCRPIVRAKNTGQAVRKIKKGLATGISHV